MDVGRVSLLHAFAVALVGFNEAASLRQHDPGSSGACSAPDEVRVKAAGHGMVFLGAASTHVVYATMDDGEDGPEEETHLLIFNCVTKKELIFLHIPKNAGTSIEDLGSTHGEKFGRFHNYHDGLWESDATQKMPDGNVCSWWHVPPELKGPPNPYADPDAEVFCVTRDPWLRMRSEYVYLLYTHHKWPKPFVKDGPACTANGLNTWALRSLWRYEAGQPFMLDCHLVPQWSYIQGSRGRRWCQTLLPIEELTPRFNALMQANGLPIRMKPYSKANSASSHCPALSNAPVSQVFWPATQAAMRRVYMQDFLHLGDSLAVDHQLINTRDLENHSGVANTSGPERQAAHNFSKAQV